MTAATVSMLTPQEASALMFFSSRVLDELGKAEPDDAFAGEIRTDLQALVHGLPFVTNPDHLEEFATECRLTCARMIQAGGPEAAAAVRHGRYLFSLTTRMQAVAA